MNDQTPATPRALPLVDTALLLNPCYQTIIYNLEDTPRISVFKSNYHPPSAQSASLSASNRWGLFVNTDDGKVLLVDLLNLNTYTLKEHVENTGRDRGFNIFAKISSDGRYAVTSLNNVEFWDLCPSQNLPFEEVLGLASSFGNSLEPQISAARGDTDYQDTFREIPAVPASLSDEIAQRALQKYR